MKESDHKSIRAGINQSESVNFSFDATARTSKVSGLIMGLVIAVGVILTNPRESLAQGPLWAVAGDGTHTIVTSSDGQVWTGRSIKGTIFDQADGVVWGNDMWVALGSGAYTIATSQDGLTWTGRSVSNDIFSFAVSAAWNGSKWVAVGAGTYSIAVSDDGINWRGVDNTSGIFSNVNDVAWNGSKWVAVGKGNRTIAFSDDGEIWTGAQDSPFTDQGYDVAWNGSKWVAVGGSLSTTTATSMDGNIWTPVSDPVLTFFGSGIAWGDGRWVAVGNSVDHTIATSVDGTNWNGRGRQELTLLGSDVAWGDGRWVAVGAGSYSIATSIDDGTTWSSADSPLTFAYGVGFGYTGVGWSEPDPSEIPPSGGPSKAPLNVSGIAQTKAGVLYVENTLDITGSGLTAAGRLTVTGQLSVSPDGTGEICLNGECRTDINQDQPDYVHLRSSDDYQTESGYLHLGDGVDEGRMLVVADSPIGLLGQAGEPTLIDGATYGLLGVAGTSPNFTTALSSGVYGEARLDDNNSIGLGGTALNPAWNSAYAAYFSGRVMITGCLKFNGGACLTAWPNTAPSGQYVKLLQDDLTTQVGNVALDPDSSTSVFSNLTLGGDPSGLGIDITCGDGVCNNGETRFTCEEDCFRILQLAAGSITDGSAVITWNTVIPATSIVEYGETDEFAANEQSQTLTANHSVVLSSLNYNTTYYYQVTSVSESGRTRKSGLRSFSTLLDQSPPPAPTNLRVTTLNSTKIPLAWYHTMTDTPGGSGLNNFIIYRDGLPAGSTTNTYYEDTQVTSGATYTYSVKAIDNSSNQSVISNELVVNVPNSCATDLDCTDPNYPVCCVPNGCKASCEGGSGSPVVLKVYSEPFTPGGDWEPGGGWE